MKEEKKGKSKGGFFKTTSDFFNKITQNDELQFSDNSVSFVNKKQEEEKQKHKREIQVFNTILQSRNWQGKHLELLEEYRQMDNNYPIISAALKIFSQEACLTGDTLIETSGGPKRIDFLYAKQDLFVVKAINERQGTVSWAECSKVAFKGTKTVYEVQIGNEKNILKCTIDHKIKVKEGFKELKELSVGDFVNTLHYDIDPNCGCKMAVVGYKPIISIKELGEEYVYDLVDVDPYNSFLVKTSNDNYVNVHNCSRDTDGNILKVNSDNERVKMELENLFIKQLKLNSQSALIIKSFLKFGNHYSFLDCRKGEGVIDLMHLKPEMVRIKIENQNEFALNNFKYTLQTAGSLEFENWELVHFKFLDDIETLPYGQSILRSIVETYRRVIMMRDALIIYRITRAPQRLFFKLDSGALDPDAAELHAKEIKKQLFKKPLVNPQTGEFDYKYSPMPLAHYTPIPLLDGRVLTLKELSEEYNQEKTNYVFSIKDDTNEIVPGKIEWAGKNYSATKLYRIHLDNETYIDSAGEHPFILRNGKEIRADKIKQGDSLMPLYLDYEKIRKNKDYTYQKVYNPNTNKFEFTHRIISKENIKDNPNHNTVHHIDFNRYNNNPDNLQWVDFNEHKKMHSELTKRNWSLNKEEKRRNMTTFFNEEIFTSLSNFITIKTTEEEIVSFINDNFINLLKEINPKITNIKVSNTILRENLKRNGYKDVLDYKSSILNMTRKEILSKIYSDNQTEYFNSNTEQVQKHISSIISANEKYGKIDKMNSAYKQKIKNGEISFKGENNPNFKGTPEVETIISFLNERVRENFAEFNEDYKQRFPEHTPFKSLKYLCEKIGMDKMEVVNNNFLYSNGFNHTVTNVEVIEENVDVYCMTIVGPNRSDDRHNFAIGGYDMNGVFQPGVFVKNSIQENIYLNSFEGDVSDVRVLEGACLKGDVKIKTTDGLMPIKDIADYFEKTTKKIYVLAMNKHKKEVNSKINWCIKTNNVKELYKITYLGMFDREYTIETTDNHPFMIPDLSYVEARNLKVGDVLKGIGEDGYITPLEYKILNIDIVAYPEGVDVYDMEVEEHHNFALEGGIFVHNSNLDAIEDYKIIKDDIFSGLMIPKQYLQFDDVQSAKAALVQEDIRFANIIRQIQGFFIEGLLHIAIVHLHQKGFSKEDIESFTIEMNTNSTFAEKTRKELLEQRFAIAQMAWDPTNEGFNFLSFTQTLKEILKFTDTQIKKIIEDQFIEKKMSWRLMNLSQNGFYEEPAQDKEAREAEKREEMSVFNNLQFESKDFDKDSIKEMLTENLEKEIKHLLTPVIASPTKKQVIDLFEGVTFKLNNSIHERLNETRQALKD